MEEILLTSLLFIIGISIGSFLNVLIDRVPREESVVAGRSHCDSCKKTLQWFDLVPLFSFLWLRGKCRYCKTSIGTRTVIVECITGIFFVATFSTLVPGIAALNGVLFIELLYFLFIISCLIVIFFCDLKYEIIPDVVVYPGIIISLAYLLFLHPPLLFPSMLTALCIFLFFLVLFLVTKGKGMGFGDVKLVFLIGLLLGFPLAIVSIYISFLTGAIISLILILWRKKKFRGNTIPFGPFLVFGVLISFYAKDLLLVILHQVLPL